MNLMLIHCDQSAQSSRRKLLEHDRVGRLVALEDLRLDQRRILGFGAKLFGDLGLRFAKR